MPYCFAWLGYKILYIFALISMHFWYSLRFEGRQNIPKGCSAIFASNHRSYLDPVMVAMAYPKPFNYMAKWDLFKNPVFSTLIRCLGAFPTENPRKPAYSGLAEARKRLNRRRNLTIFPEGTRHTDGKVGRGHSGMCVLSAYTQKPIIPVGIIFDSNNLHFRSKICVRIGTPVCPEDFGLTAASTTTEMRPMRDEVMRQIRQMVEEDPPFPITHDTPRKRTSRELAQEKRKAQRQADA